MDDTAFRGAAARHADLARELDETGFEVLLAEADRVDPAELDHLLFK